MAQLSNAVKFLSNRFSGVFTKKSIEELISKDKISYEAAAEAMSVIPANDKSQESAEEVVSMTTDQKTIITKKALQNYFEGAKFDAMLNQVKEDDTLLYNEFQNIDNARARIMAEIVKKEEFNYNTLLDEIKTTGGTNQDILDKLIQTKVSVDEVKY